MSSRRTNRCPESEGTIDMDPGTHLVRDLAEFAYRIACSCVHVAHLDANDRGPGNARDLRRFHPSLRVARDRTHLCDSKTEYAERLEHCCGDLFANNYCHRRRAKQAVLFKVPAHFAQEIIARGSEGGDVRHLRARHKRSARSEESR